MIHKAISIEELTVQFGRKLILSVDKLEVAHGELLGILGPNGAGKTTLLRCLLGMQRHAKGIVNIFGSDMNALDSRNKSLLRRRIGYVPQLLPVNSEMPLTVREIVSIGRTGISGLFGRLGSQDWNIVDEWIERLGLSSLANRGYGEISGGQQRKTLIARAMVQQPEILILDEPTANLDLRWRETIVKLIEDVYVLGNLTVLLVCHELEVLPSKCRRIAILNDGRMLGDGLPETELSEQRIKFLYGPGLSLLKRRNRYLVVPSEDCNA